MTSSLSSGQGQSFSPSVAASGISFAAPATNPLSEVSGGAPPKSVPAGISAAKASVGEPDMPAGSSSSCSKSFSTASFTCGANFSNNAACALLKAESRNA